jgi:hypothetical protein
MDNNFWLTSDAGWRTPTPITPHLRDAKATCVGIIPRSLPFRDDFTVAVENAKNLQQQAATPDFNLRYGFASNGEGQSTEIKFRHVLFEVWTAASPPTFSHSRTLQRLSGNTTDDEVVDRKPFQGFVVLHIQLHTYHFSRHVVS